MIFIKYLTIKEKRKKSILTKSPSTGLLLSTIVYSGEPLKFSYKFERAKQGTSSSKYD